MLEAISWKEYGLVMGGAICLYYGWWVVKYAASLGWTLPKPKSRESGGRITGLYAAGGGDDPKEAPKGSNPAGTEASINVDQQLTLPLPESPASGPEPFLAAVAASLLKEWGELTERATAEKMVEGEFVFSLQRLLSSPPYQRLKGTVFQDKVSDRIIRDVEKMGSIRLDAQVVKGLWDG